MVLLEFISLPVNDITFSVILSDLLSQVGLWLATFQMVHLRKTDEVTVKVGKSNLLDVVHSIKGWLSILLVQ